MSIGVFLDVDNTLTKGFIQQRFAQLLGCEAEYCEIEKAFQNGVIDAAVFGDHLIELFASRGFNDAFAADHYDAIEKQSWTERVLTLNAELYLVSSGPNYYIRRLAREYKVPDDHVLCSEYGFDCTTGLLSHCDAVTDAMKSDFVSMHAHDHPITIGVGDSPEKDGPFLSNCDFPIVTKPNDVYFGTASLGSLHRVIDRLSRSPLFTLPAVQRRSEPRVFIGSSSESLDLARELDGLITDFSEPQLWSEGIFQASQVTIEDLERELAQVDFAVVIMTPDDVVRSREVELPTVRDNLVFELGMFMGSLGRERCFAVCPRQAAIKLPTDIAGLTVLTFRGREDEDNRQALVPVANELQKLFRAQGLRDLGF